LYIYIIMTVREFIEWLKTQDQDAVVNVVRHESRGGYYEQGGRATQAPFTPELSDYVDFRDNPFLTPDRECYNTRKLLLGTLDE
jgi:hypothetical protein